MFPVQIQRHGNIVDDLPRVTGVGLKQQGFRVRGQARPDRIVEDPLVPHPRDILRRIAAGGVRIAAVVGRRIAPRIHQQRVAAARHRLQHAVQQLCQRLVDAAVIGRVVARRLAAGDPLVVAIEHIQAARPRLFQQPGRGRPEGVQRLGQAVERGIAGPHVRQHLLHAFGLAPDAIDLTGHARHPLAHVGAQRRDTAHVLAHSVVGGIDLADGLHHLAHLAIHAVEIPHEMLEILARLVQHRARGVHILAQRAGLALGRIDQLQHFTGVAADIAGGRIDPFGQAADLAGHHGEAAAGVAGAGRLDPCVQGQQLRLQRDVLDQLADISHRPGAIGQLAHHIGEGGHLPGHAVDPLLDLGQLRQRLLSGAQILAGHVGDLARVGGRGCRQRRDLRAAGRQRLGRPRLFLRQLRAAAGLELGPGGIQGDLDAGLPHRGDPAADAGQEAIQRPCGRTERQRAFRERGAAVVEPAQQTPDASESECGSGQDGTSLCGPDRLLWTSVAWARAPVSYCWAPILIVLQSTQGRRFAPLGNTSMPGLAAVAGGPWRPALARRIRSPGWPAGRRPGPGW
ncbi:Uncharacterised protein [Achromobacter xylosoxidans]|nr:Uncharacterised protein [Achromobacter xylosoxidans]